MRLCHCAFIGAVWSESALFAMPRSAPKLLQQFNFLYVQTRTQGGAGGGGGGANATPSLANYFNTMQFLVRHWVYIPSGLKIKIFLRFASSCAKIPTIRTTFSKSLHTGLMYNIKQSKSAVSLPINVDTLALKATAKPWFYWCVFESHLDYIWDCRWPGGFPPGDLSLSLTRNIYVKWL